MSRSVGAVFAAMPSRGNRMPASVEQEYHVVLPPLPTGSCVLNTVFLHGDVKARPFRVEDFRDTLAHLKLLPEVVALGAFQMNHVWAVTFESAEATKKMLKYTEVQVKERRCLVVDPHNRDVRVKLHWLLHNVHDEDVHAAFAPYGKVNDVQKEQWRVPGITDKGSSMRTVTLKLKPGVTRDDLPHQLRVAGIMALVVVPGRAPLCLRCNRTGHIRRECRVPRCSVCQRFGHEESQCVRTYANVAGPSRSEEVVNEHLMDEVNAEESASASRPSLAPLSKKDPAINSTKRDVGQVASEAIPTSGKTTSAKDAETSNDASTSKQPSVATSEDDSSVMDTTETSKAAAAAKRTHEESTCEEQNASTQSVGEPPVKTATGRRPTFRPTPTIPPDRKAAATQRT
ncbi:uncharacterized protein [Dermacentor albipictus]|uniref:uncharacterized protein n=1 Tax=Dermacentor albipictus TaxID=60249 RepID=UPI0038FC9E80